jgi:predicted Zn-dependent peptidase
VVQISQAPDCEHSGRYAARLLAAILGDDTGSQLYWELVDPGLAEHAGLNHCDYEGSGVFYTYMSCPPERAAENLKRIREIYHAAETSGVTAEELATAKSKVTSRVVLGSERPRGRLFAIGGDWLQHRCYRSVRDELNAFLGVTLDDVHAVLSQFPLGRTTTVTIGPLADLSRPQ